MKREIKKVPMSPESVLRQMERHMGGAVKGRAREAQELVYDAWETADGHEAFELLRRAVELDPNNVDAGLGLMEFDGLENEEKVEALRKRTAQGETNLGKKIFAEDKGHFWGMLETRPYMRARAQLASALREMGQMEDAIAEQEGLLELNPNDNQGIRYGLMACYLAENRLDGARRLFKDYDEREFSAVWAWAAVLERLLSGDMAGALDALRDARKQNPHAQAYFLGHRKPPKVKPASYSPGSREEASIAWDILCPAWEKHPPTHAWLKAQRGK